MPLAFKVLAPRVTITVLILLAPVSSDVREHLMLRERELGNHIVEVGDGWQLALGVNRRCEQEGLALLQECATCRTIVPHDVFTVVCDGQGIKQFEVVSVHRIHEALGRALGVGELAPLVKALLGNTGHLRYGPNPVGVGQIGIVPLGDELDLVAQVKQPIVDWHGRQHEDLGAPTALDNVLDETRITSFFCASVLLLRRLWLSSMTRRS